MSDEGVDLSRRHFLTVATAVTGAGGAAIATWPFLASMKPSVKAQALGAPVEVDISKLDPGQMVKRQWRGQPVGVVRRTDDMLAGLEAIEPELSDPGSDEEQQPDFARNRSRSLRDEVFVFVASCTHLGCSPTYRPEVAPMDLGADWKGGFYCPCHGSKFDLAGRVFKGVPAPLNLVVPPHRYITDTVVLIGDSTGAQA